MGWNLDDKPILVFWETTRSCDLACRHCRAAAIASALPDELTHEQGLDLLDQITEFGKPYPILIMTGGDVLKRNRFWDTLQAATDRGISVSVSPSVTPLLDEQVMARLKDAGIAAMSLSLDGADEESHDGLRGVPGTYKRTLELIEEAARLELRLQINTTVMGWNIRQMPEIFEQIHKRGAEIWEVFFLIHEGRGQDMDAASAEQCEAVCQFLAEASYYGLTLRTVEAPFFRRIVKQREEGTMRPLPLGQELIDDLQRRLGPPTHRPRYRSAQTRDGKGLLFVNYKGEVSPSGFLPVTAGDVIASRLPELYRNHPIFRDLRLVAGFKGRCGECTYQDLCGGSRARAYAWSGDYLSEDPACAYVPALLETAEAE